MYATARGGHAVIRMFRCRFPDHGEGPVENFESISAEARTGALIDSMATMM